MLVFFIEQCIISLYLKHYLLSIESDNTGSYKRESGKRESGKRESD